MSTESDVAVYQALAAHHDMAGEAALRDRYLVLAADAALTAGRPAEAERMRQRLLRHSRSHLLGPYPSFVEAQNTADVKLLVAELRRSCPPQEARRLLEAVRRGKPAVPAAPKRSPLPQTAGDLAVELDSTWLPEVDAKPGSGDLLERTGDIDVAAALGEEPAPTAPSRPRPVPAAPAAPRPRPAPPANQPLPQTAARPVLPRIQPALPAPAPEPAPAQPHAWVATFLAVVVIGIGLALAGYSLIKPFVP